MLLRKVLSRSPVTARVAPFVVFVALTVAQGRFSPDSAYWFYLAKTLVGIWLIAEIYPLVTEMRWAFGWEAIAVGIGIFAVWVGVSGEWTTQDSLWVKLGLAHAPKMPPAEWNPHEHFGHGLAGLFIIIRILGSTWVVPPLEEVFYR